MGEPLQSGVSGTSLPVLLCREGFFCMGDFAARRIALHPLASDSFNQSQGESKTPPDQVLFYDIIKVLSRRAGACRTAADR